MYRLKEGESIDVTTVFIQTTPETIEIDPETGTNNLQKAKMAQYEYLQTTAQPLSIEFMRGWDRELTRVVLEFSA